MTTTKTAARVARYKAEYGDIYFAHDADRDAFRAAFGAIAANVTEAIADGSDTEALAWATLGTLVSYRYRKVA